MATQPRDRQKMKHQSKVAKRTAPKLVIRSNKTLLKVWVPHHVLHGRFRNMIVPEMRTAGALWRFDKFCGELSRSEALEVLVANAQSK